MPVGGVGSARVEIVGDVSKFARQVQDDLNRALRGIRLEGLDRQLNDIGRAARENADDMRDAFQRGGEAAEDALGEIGDRGEREFDRLEREARDASRSAATALGGSLGGAIRGLGPAVAGIGAALAAVGIGRFIADAVQAADELGDAMAISEQIIEQTGGAAGLMADEVRGLSRELSLEIGVDSAQVQSAANVLLTFRNVSEDTFGTALGLAADLSTVLGTDLQGATLQLGKALNDPVRGVTALSRAGVQFTDSQREQIASLVESNDLLGAQQIILGELESQVGGTAAVAADSWAIVANTFREVQRSLGDALIPAIDALAPSIIDTISALEPAFSAIGSGLGDALTAFGPGLQELGAALGEGLAALAPALGPVGGALGAIAAAVAPLLPVLGRLIGVYLTPFAQIVQALAEPLGVVAQILAEHMTQALTMLEPHLPAIVALFGEIATVLSENLQQTLPIISEMLLELIAASLPLIPTLIELTEALLPFIANADGMVLILTLLTDLITFAIVPALEQLNALLQGDFADAFPLVTGQIDILRSVVESVFGFVSDFIGDSVDRVRGILNGIGGVVSNVIGFFTDLRDGARERFDALVGFVRDIPGRILAALGDLDDLLLGAGRQVVQGLIDGIRGAFGEVQDVLGDLTGMLPDWKGPAQLDRQILREAGREVMRGFQHGIEDERDNVRRQLQGMTTDISAPGFVGQVAGGDGASFAASGPPAEFVATAVIDLGEGVQRVIDISFQRRDRGLVRQALAGAGRIR